MIALILEVIKFALAIFTAAREDKKKSDAENAAFVIDQARRKAWADAAIQKLGQDAKEDTKKAGNAWDKQDEENKIHE